MSIPQMQTTRLSLDAMRLDFADRLFEIYRDPETSRYWNGPDRNRRESEERITRMLAHWKDHGYGDWALIDKTSGKMIGYCGLHHISSMDEVNLGFLIDRSFWGSGLATEAGNACLEFGFARAGLRVIVGTAAPDNVGAVKVLRKLGMSYWKEIERNGARSVFRIDRDAWQATNAAVETAS